MTAWPVHGKIDGPIVMIGFGSIGKGTLPLIERHFKFDKKRFVVIDPKDKDRKLLDKHGVRFVHEAVTKENYRDLLTPLLTAGKGRGFCVNLSVDVASIAVMELCREIGALYVDTVVEPWPGLYFNPKESAEGRSNYNLREQLLEAARRHGVERFLQVSTDEVYGPRFPDSPAREDDPFRPTNPYAASKAGGEMQCVAAFRAYGLPLVIARSGNNIGPRQHPEKAVPLFVTNALDDQPLPVYGEGLQVRDRLYVEDNCEALDLILHEGTPGEAYNVGADNERPNIEVVETILRLLGKPRSLIRFVADRTFHDARYSLDTAKVRALGWTPRHDFDAAMAKTVAWYRDNRWWWEKVKSGEYAAYYRQQYGERLAKSRGL